MTESRIRTLYLQPSPLFGGAERQAAEQAAYLPRLGIDPIVVGGPGRVIARWMDDLPAGRFVHSPNFPDDGTRRSVAGRLGAPWRYAARGLAARSELVRIVEREHIDLVVASLPYAWIVGSLVARDAGIPVVWRAGGSRIPLWQKAGLWCFTRFMRPDLLLCNAEAVRTLFSPLVPAPVAVVPNGVDARVFHPRAGDAGRYRPRSAESVVGFAGRLARSKHPEAIVSLAARLRDSSPGAHVLVAGDGGERAACERVAQRLGLENLSFLGFVYDMPSFYAACDVIVLPSDSEGCPNVILEAMMSAKPVVASGIPPVRELVEPETTGLLVPLGDTSALADAVSRLLRDPRLGLTLARAAYERVRGFTVAATARELARVFRMVVGGARSFASVELATQRVSATTTRD